MQPSLRDDATKFEVSVTADAKGLDSLHAALATFFDSPGVVARVSIEQRLRVEIAVAELAANSIKHAAAQTLRLRLTLAETFVEAVFEDDGDAFEASESPLVGEFAESGRGLQLIEAAVDELLYERIEDVNKWFVSLRVGS